MAHDTRSSPPVALRVVRPFATEAQLLEAEASAFTRTGVVLIGAASRPNGVVLRFEIALRDGAAVMRGEGRVVGYRAPTGSDEGALMLRFTRLDVKSKALLDRAVAIREERRSLVPPGGRPSGSSQSSMPAATPQAVAASAAAPTPSPAPGAVSSPPPIPRPASAAPTRGSLNPAAAFGHTPPRPGIPSVAPTVQASPSPPPADSDNTGSVEVDVVDDDDDEGTGEVDVSEVEEVDDEDISPVALDEGDLTVHAPPVEMVASGPAPHIPPEHMPAPSPSPAMVPPPQIAPETPAPPQQAPERAPPPQRSPEYAPPPQRSPARGPETQKLDANVREGALERLRARAKKLTDLGSFFPVGERSSAPDQLPATAGPREPSMTPVLGSYVVAERGDKQ